MSATVRCPLPWVYDDGGREAAGFRGRTRDCGVRALAIASGFGYQEIYDIVHAASRRERPRKGWTRSHPRTGIHAATFRRIVAGIGGEWTPTMRIGSGCQVHLAVGELPLGRLVANVSRHFCAVIDGVVRDTDDPTRDGNRCVYGYWTFPEEPQP